MRFLSRRLQKETHDLELECAMEESKNNMSKRDCDYMLQKKKFGIGIGWKDYDDLEETDLELERALNNSLETYQRSEGSRKMPSAVGRGRGQGRGRFGAAVGAMAVGGDLYSQHSHSHLASNINMNVHGNRMDGMDVNGTGTGARLSLGRSVEVIRIQVDRIPTRVHHRLWHHCGSCVIIICCI